MDYVYKRVGAIEFGVLSPKLIKKMAAAKIVTYELYDKEGYPVDGGLMDIRLGVIDPGLRCKTCGKKLKECIGHFGYVELARPVIHVKFIKPILNTLKSLCNDCSKILVSEDKLSEYSLKLESLSSSDARREVSKELVSKARLVKKCPHCGKKKLAVKVESATTFLEGEKRINPIDIRARLEKVSDENAKLLGFNVEYARPEWMVLNLLSVPPVTVRPSITLDTGERSEDDLTHKLGDIIRINQRLFENINAGAPEIIIEDLWDLLQYHVTTFFDNSMSTVLPARHRSGQPLKTLTERIKSKEGRFRYNLAGKRVNFSARSVISPDPMIKFNEVGVPKSVAMELTIPETVTEWNKEWLKEFIKKGPYIYPGANYVIRPDGKKKRITEDILDQLLEELQPGYIVERHLMDADVSIFNRQPSLHRMSIMCHKIRVLPGKSFRLNPAVCTPYNADFDGDEMNLHIPQTEEARSEAELLMSVQYHIISPKNGMNIIGCIEDSIAGNYLLTKEMIFTKEEAVGLLLTVGINNSKRFKEFKEKVTGREMFSVLLPKDFNFVGQVKGYSEGDKDGLVIVENGNLVSGYIDAATIGEDGGTLIRAIYAKYGEQVGIELLSEMFKLGIEVLRRRGFTTGVGDSDLSKNMVEKNNKLLNVAREDVENLIQQFMKGKLDVIVGLTAEDSLELKILEVLNKVRNVIGKSLSEINDKTNHTLVMARSGAKGSILNLAQMASCVGQLSMSGRRISRGYKGRTLSFFKKGDLRPGARGFVDKGYKKGLNPSEYFFGAMTGRDSLMDTALRTPKSGYLYRRLANALQDLRVEYDKTVRDASGAIVQFKYGDDSMDVAKSEGGSINVRDVVRGVVGK